MSEAAGVQYLRHNVYDGSERDALVAVSPSGFHIRHPPKPFELDTDITDDSQLFQTIHMGAAVVDRERWRLVVDGMVENPFSVDLKQLQAMPSSACTAFHECYGSPLVAPTKAVWRIGNVKWTGVRLSKLLELAKPLKSAKYVWSDGLEHGSFGGVEADKYQKDLPMEKAKQPEVLLAYLINGEPLDKERGGPARLIVPGWFGTNSTKWICHISLQDRRAPGPFTTRFYNEIDPNDLSGKSTRPVWQVEPNSIIVRPKPGEVSKDEKVKVWGRAWACHDIVKVELSIDGGETWLVTATLHQRTDFEWQRFEAVLSLPNGKYEVMSRATSKDGLKQPLQGRRNHVHAVNFEVQNHV